MFSTRQTHQHTTTVNENNPLPPIRIMIVDDHAVIRSGLRMLIEQDPMMSVVAMAGNPSEALALAEAEKPDIIVLDLMLGEEDGLEFLPDLCRKCPSSRVLVL